MRIATFNIENLDTTADSRNPPLADRIPTLRSTLNRINADILCLQEVHGQELPDHTSTNPKRNLGALDQVIQGTAYENFHRAFTKTSGVPYDKRNLVILSRHPIAEEDQFRNDHIDKLKYNKVTEVPADPEAETLTWERPILQAQISHPDLGTIHVINLHMKSRLASNIKGQKDGFAWKSASGWAEGYFLSSIKRVGQALETRVLIDKIFEDEPNANIVVCGDFNAEPGEVPVEAIQGRVENTNNPKLGSQVLVPCSRAIPDTVRFSHLHHGHGNLLDHMLISKSLLPYFQEAVIFNETLHDESLPFQFDTLYPESDHAPFVAEFKVS